ncbi:UPF0175 family protein [Halomicrococcus sp. SG-WS-1]|uniref:UPF0175 family protein n=1 Tax=Halomicrococcus sp. SG-WS-1 TaxID=3439057 RepID=UPI003F78C28A
MTMADARTRGGRDELATVIGLYALGELTLGEAADRLDVSRYKMRDILRESGVQVRLGPESAEDARDDASNALDIE